jgi:hypothetical protein
VKQRGRSSVAEDNLSRACAKVGRFLHEFALVEQEINEGIVQILKLSGDAADVLIQSLSFRRKAGLLQTAALETAPPEEKEGIAELFKAIDEQNKHRNIMAHWPFDPATNEDVQFRRAAAKDTQPWPKQKFEECYNRLREIRGKLTEMRPRVTIRISERGTEIFSHYLYTPSSTWVPPGDDT